MAAPLHHPPASRHGVPAAAPKPAAAKPPGPAAFSSQLPPIPAHMGGVSGASGGGGGYAEPEGDINDATYGEGAGENVDPEEMTFQQSKYYVRPVPSIEELRMLRSGRF